MNDVTLHCMACGAVLHEIDGEMGCPVGGSGMSTYLLDGLTALVESPPSPSEATIAFDASYRCPADGEPLVWADDRYVCSACGRFVPGSLLLHFVEFDDGLGHQWVDGQWRVRSPGSGFEPHGR